MNKTMKDWNEFDQCCFLIEEDGKFKKCKVLKVTACPKNCKFCKADWQFSEEAKKAERRLMELGLTPTVIESSEADRCNVMSVRKTFGEE